MSNLFTNTPLELNLKDGHLIYLPNIFSEKESLDFHNYVKHKTTWKQDDITVFGKTYLQPRLTALYGEKSYSYSNITMHPTPFSPKLLGLKHKVEQLSQSKFNVCLFNFYRDGNDSNGWHSDDEKELGLNPTIASLSFGGPRYFHIRHKTDKTLKHKLLLEHNSLLIMSGPMQHHWQHQIPKSKRLTKPRINLTFRNIG